MQVHTAGLPQVATEYLRQIFQFGLGQVFLEDHQLVKNQASVVHLRGSTTVQESPQVHLRIRLPLHKHDSFGSRLGTAATADSLPHYRPSEVLETVVHKNYRVAGQFKVEAAGVSKVKHVDPFGRGTVFFPGFDGSFVVSYDFKRHSVSTCDFLYLAVHVFICVAGEKDNRFGG